MSSENKADWGQGPWQGEPDEKNWVDKTTGLNCKILRGPVGALCGYVGISKEHPAYGMSYNPVEYTIDENIEWWRRHVTQRTAYKIDGIQVHGGLTFAGPFTGSDLHWFGFDCSHSFDLAPRLDFGSVLLNAGQVYRDIEYVIKKVESLAKQLAAIKREDHEQTGTG